MGACPSCELTKCNFETQYLNKNLQCIDREKHCPNGTYLYKNSGKLEDNTCITCPVGTYKSEEQINIENQHRDKLNEMNVEELLALVSSLKMLEVNKEDLGDTVEAMKKTLIDKITNVFKTCDPCPLGYFQDEEGASECKRKKESCVPGEMLTINSETTIDNTCNVCPENTFSTDGLTCKNKTAIQSCAKGMGLQVNGNDKNAECSPCTNKTYSTDADLHCIPKKMSCPPGKYLVVSTTNYTDNECLLCPHGKFTLDGITCKDKTDITCSKGMEKQLNGPDKDAECVSCAPETFSIDDGKCLKKKQFCSPGEYLLRNSSKEEDHSCLRCYDGTFSQDGITCTKKSDIVCAKGMEKQLNGPEKDAECVTCTPGTFSTDGVKCVPKKNSCEFDQELVLNDSLEMDHTCRSNEWNPIQMDNTIVDRTVTAEKCKEIASLHQYKMFQKTGNSIEPFEWIGIAGDCAEQKCPEKILRDVHGSTVPEDGRGLEFLMVLQGCRVGLDGPLKNKVWYVPFKNNTTDGQRTEVCEPVSGVNRDQCVKSLDLCKSQGGALTYTIQKGPVSYSIPMCKLQEVQEESKGHPEWLQFFKKYDQVGSGNPYLNGCNTTDRDHSLECRKHIESTRDNFLECTKNDSGPIYALKSCDPTNPGYDVQGNYDCKFDTSIHIVPSWSNTQSSFEDTKRFCDDNASCVGVVESLNLEAWGRAGHSYWPITSTDGITSCNEGDDCTESKKLTRYYMKEDYDTACRFKALHCGTHDFTVSGNVYSYKVGCLS